jgi:hypothetical protein
LNSYTHVNIVPSLATSSLLETNRITNQSSVNLNFVKRVGSCPLFRSVGWLLVPSSVFCTSYTRLLGFGTPLSLLVAHMGLQHAGTHAADVLHAGKTVRERGGPSIAISLFNRDAKVNVTPPVPVTVSVATGRSTVLPPLLADWSKRGVGDVGYPRIVPKKGNPTLHGHNLLLS